MWSRTQQEEMSYLIKRSFSVSLMFYSMLFTPDDRTWRLHVPPAAM